MAPKFKVYSPAEKRRVLKKYRRLIDKGKTPTAAARMAGTSYAVIARWIEAEEAAPVAVVKERPCLGGCGNTIQSTPGHRLCDTCSARISALPRAFSA